MGSEQQRMIFMHMLNFHFVEDSAFCANSIHETRTKVEKDVYQFKLVGAQFYCSLSVL